MVNIYKKPDDGPFDGPVTKRQIRQMKKIEPVLPTQSGYVLDHYKHNGFLLNLPLGRYLIASFSIKSIIKLVKMACTASPSESDPPKPVKFMVRTMGSNIDLRPLTSTS